MTEDPGVEAIVRALQEHRWYDTQQIAQLYQLAPRTIHNRAFRSRWRRRTHPTNNRKRQYNAADVQKSFGPPRRIV